MDSIQFKSAIDAVSDEIINYIDTVHTRRVMSNVEPGYLKKLLPDHPPEDGEEWDEIQKDIESKIMPGMTHWNSPNFMAYFPAPTTYPSMLGELYSSALAVSAFNWDCAPAVTELEVIVMDWLAKIINLPSCFLSSGNGGGVIQGTTSEAILALMVAARERYLHQTTAHFYGVEKETAIAQRRLRMVALGSEACHSCTQKAAMIIGMRYRSIPVYLEDGFSMTGDSLRDTLKQCQEEGLEPFYLTTTLGTTATCAVDKFDELAQVLRGHRIWVHVDAAYAGSALVCEEYQSLTEHLGSFDSFSMSMSKWLLTNIDAVCCFIKNKHHLVDALSITPAYLRNDASDSGAVVDFRHWGVPLSRRFRALKIWFVMRTYGVNGFKAYIRNHIKLGLLFASLVASRPNLFRIVTPPAFALTVISIVPRVPALLRQYMAIKAKELKLKEEPRTNGAYYINGNPKVNGTTHVNSEPKINGEAIVNRKPVIREKTHINGESRSKEEIYANGGPRINGTFKTNGMSNMNGTAAIVEQPHVHGDPKMNQELIFNGIIDVNERIGINGEPGTNTEPHTNGVTKINSTFKTNGTSTINGEPKLNGFSRIKDDPTANIEATSCTEEWYTEYANMVTKAVYNLVNRQGEIMLTSTVIGGLFVIRVNGANPKTEEKYLRRAFDILVAAAEEVLDGA